MPRILAFLDDTYMISPTSIAKEAIHFAEVAFREIGLKLNTSKTALATDGLPHPDLASKYRQHIKVLGVTHQTAQQDSTLPTYCEREGTPLDPEDQQDPLLLLQQVFVKNLHTPRQRRLSI